MIILCEITNSFWNYDNAPVKCTFYCLICAKIYIVLSISLNQNVFINRFMK